MQQFIDKGEVSLSESSREQGSPLVFAILIAAVRVLNPFCFASPRFQWLIRLAI